MKRVLAVAVAAAPLPPAFDVLMRLSLVIKLGAWTSGEARREIKNAKHDFTDTGIAAALRNLAPRSFDPDSTALRNAAISRTVARPVVGSGCGR